MILDALREASRRMVNTPVLWITGLYLGSLFALELLLQFGGDTLFGARLGFLGLCAFPLFLGGSYGVIRGGATGIRGYFEAGARYYFRILLAWAVIVSAALLTAFLALIPATILGGTTRDIIPFVFLGVIIPFAFFTSFADTAAIFDDRRVLDSIRRSVEFVTGNPGGAVGFYLVSLGIGMLILFVSVVIWSFAIADRLEPLIGANQTAFQNLTAPELLNLIGVPGLWAGLTIGFLAVMVGVALLVSFKACFFRRMALSAPAPALQGEFDEKGRWYRY